MKKYFFLFILLFIGSLSAQQEEKNSLSQMLSAGAISVTIGGDFIVTGSFPAMITERVDQFITRMYNEASQNLLKQAGSDPVMLEKAKRQLDTYSIRTLTLKRANGQELQLDLLKFRTTGDFENNPYLKNDDVIIFPPMDLERNFFSIYGAVNKPGKYNFRDGDKLSDAIKLAQGINKGFDNVTGVDINRLSNNGETMETIRVGINDDTPLQRGDRIVVVASENQKREFTVRVIGEVNNPGEVPITKNTTTIRQALQRAGGLTEFASLKRAKLFTGNSFYVALEKIYGIKIDQQQEIPSEKITQVSDMIVNLEKGMMYRMSNITELDTSYFFLENQLRVLMEGSSLDFTTVMDENSEIGKQIVHDGDIIIIPHKETTVYVFGQVGSPGSVNFEEGRDAKYYINKAGGLGELAEDEEEIMLIKSGSRQWIPINDAHAVVEEGDFIYVPKVPVHPFNYYVNTAANYLSIVASTATIILLLLQLNKNNR